MQQFKGLSFFLVQMESKWGPNGSKSSTCWLGMICSPALAVSFKQTMFAKTYEQTHFIKCFFFSLDVQLPSVPCLLCWQPSCSAAYLNLVVGQTNAWSQLLIATMDKNVCLSIKSQKRCR